MLKSIASLAMHSPERRGEVRAIANACCGQARGGIPIQYC